MENGEVIEMGTVKDVFSHPQTNTAKNFVSTVINTEPSKSYGPLLTREKIQISQIINCFRL